jgi:hypothetical protein
MIDLTALAAALTTLRQTKNASPSMIGASPQQVATLYAAISGAQAAAAAASEAADVILGSPTTPASAGAGSSVAGVVAGSDGAALAAAFGDYIGVAEQAPDLFDLENYLIRMATNLTLSSGQAFVSLPSHTATVPPVAAVATPNPAADSTWGSFLWGSGTWGSD